MRTFDELPVIPGTDERHAWHEFGDSDEFGTLNRITPERVKAAAALVRTGKVFALTMPLDQPDAAPDSRPVYTHEILRERNGRDDSLSGFFMSASSQWDGLRHVRFRQHGYYGGREDEEIDADGSLGMDRVAARGIITRAVLIDIPRYMAAHGHEWNPRERVKITPEHLDACLAWEGTEVGYGDVVLVRTGWLADWMDRPVEERAGLVGGGAHPGLDPSARTAAWLWDHGVAAVACDNMAVEPMPLDPKNDGFLHYRLLPLLGMLMGEQFDLEGLAADCDDDRVYESMFSSAPLRVPHGVCSPPNAYAVK